MNAPPKAPHLVLPDGAREAMRIPLGPIVQTAGLAPHLAGAAALVSVGDMVTLTLVEAGREVSLALFDYRTKRTEGRDFRRKLHQMQGEWVTVRNPPATITLELWEALKRAFVKVKAGARVRIEVDGEEDLAAIPAILLAPKGTRVLYGMPGRGMVVVAVDTEARRKAKALLDLMEPREGWKHSKISPAQY